MDVFFFGTANTSPSLPTSLTPPHFLTSHTPHKFVHFNPLLFFFCIIGFFSSWFHCFKKSSSHGVHPSNPFWVGFKVCSSPTPPAAFSFVSFRTSSHRSRNLARSLHFTTLMYQLHRPIYPQFVLNPLLLLAYPRSTFSIIPSEALFLLSVGVGSRSTTARDIQPPASTSLLPPSPNSSSPRKSLAVQSHSLSLSIVVPIHVYSIISFIPSPSLNFLGFGMQYIYTYDTRLTLYLNFL